MTTMISLTIKCKRNKDDCSAKCADCIQTSLEYFDDFCETEHIKKVLEVYSSLSI